MSQYVSFMFNEYTEKILCLLLLQPNQRYHVREIARLTNTIAGTLHKELSKLAAAEVLIREKSGRQVYYRANQSFLLFDDLVNILLKTSGIRNILAEMLTPHRSAIKAALIYGSIANKTASTESDIDVLIVGDISYLDSVKALHPAQAILRREINPKVYTEAEWKKMTAGQNAFALAVMKSSTLFILGDLDDLR